MVISHNIECVLRNRFIFYDKPMNISSHNPRVLARSLLIWQLFYFAKFRDMEIPDKVKMIRVKLRQIWIRIPSRSSVTFSFFFYLNVLNTNKGN